MNKDNIIFLFFTICCISLTLLPTGFEGGHSTDSHLVKAKVLSVDNTDLRQNLIVYTGTQDVQVQLMEGPHDGMETRVVNPLAGKLEFDEIYAPGDYILVEYKYKEGTVHLAFTRGYYRLTHELLLIVLFCGLIIGVAGFTGVKALLSFVFAGLMIWKVLIPLF